MNNVLTVALELIIAENELECKFNNQSFKAIGQTAQRLKVVTVTTLCLFPFYLRYFFLVPRCSSKTPDNKRASCVSFFFFWSTFCTVHLLSSPSETMIKYTLNSWELYNVQIQLVRQYPCRKFNHMNYKCIIFIKN